MKYKIRLSLEEFHLKVRLRLPYFNKRYIYNKDFSMAFEPQIGYWVYANAKFKKEIKSRYWEANKIRRD